MENRLNNLIKLCFDDETMYKNIGVIGEYGAGKSTIIKNVIQQVENEEHTACFDISLMSSISKTRNSRNIINMSDEGVKEANLDEIKLNVDFLNSIYQLIQVSLLEVSKFPKIYGNSTIKDEETSFNIILLIIGISITIITLNLFPAEIKYVNITLILIIKTLLLISGSFYICYALYNFFRLKRFTFTKLGIAPSEIAIKIDEMNNITNEKEFINGIYYMIDLHQKKTKSNKYIFIFEDMDRVAGIISIEFLRELNSRLNILLKEKNVNVLFIYSLRVGLLEKTSVKRENTRSRTKLEKYFFSTLYIKSINTSRYKSYLFDLKEVTQNHDTLTSLEHISPSGTYINEIVDREFNHLFQIYKKSNIEIYTDFRVYKSFILQVSYPLNDYINNFKSSKDSGNIVEGINDIIDSEFLIVATKHSADFLSEYMTIVEKINWYSNTVEISKVDILKIVKKIEKRIIKKYSVSNEKIFSDREIKFFEAFISKDFVSNKKVSQRYVFLSSIGIDSEEIYLKETEQNFDKYKNINVDIGKIQKIYENALPYERKIILENIIKKPNICISERFFIFCDKLKISDEDINKIVNEWFEILIKNKEEKEFIKILDIKVMSILKKNKLSDDLMKVIESNLFSKNNFDQSIKSDIDKVKKKVEEYNNNRLSLPVDYIAILIEFNSYTNRAVNKTNVTGELYQKIYTDYNKTDHSKNGNRNKPLVTMIDKILDR